MLSFISDKIPVSQLSWCNKSQDYIIAALNFYFQPLQIFKERDIPAGNSNFTYTVRHF